VVTDADRRSKDILAWRDRTCRHAGSAQSKANPIGEERLSRFIYAEEGLWYDALQSISDLMTPRPKTQNWASSVRSADGRWLAVYQRVGHGQLLAVRVVEF